MDVQIYGMQKDEDIIEIKELIKFYANELPKAHICFSDLEVELSNLFLYYQIPLGNIFIAKVGNNPVGCIAIKPYNDTTAEIKRMYVKPDFRKNGIANLLLDSAEDFSANLYSKLFLYTLPDVMISAVKLYIKRGFIPKQDDKAIVPCQFSVRYEKPIKRSGS